MTAVVVAISFIAGVAAGAAIAAMRRGAHLAEVHRAISAVHSDLAIVKNKVLAKL